jgi:hypothetical protein
MKITPDKVLRIWGLSDQTRIIAQTVSAESIKGTRERMQCYSQLRRKIESLGSRKPAASPQNVKTVKKGPDVKARALIDPESPAAGACPG